ncbi:MAG TPA: complex I subunit 1 family protein [Candidatus Acidoferrales bacterium]
MDSFGLISLPAAVPSALSAMGAVLALPLLVAYTAFIERRIAEAMDERARPVTPGALGLLRYVARIARVGLGQDEGQAELRRRIFAMAPAIALVAALIGYAVMPVGPAFQVADPNVGLLFILGLGALGIYGVLLRGEASAGGRIAMDFVNHAAQVVSCQAAAALGLLSGVLLAGSLAMGQIVQAQLDQGQWFIFYVPAGFFIYFVGSMAAMNRATAELPAADADLFSVDALADATLPAPFYVLADYVSVIVVAGIATTVFLGGWLRPMASFRDRVPGTTIEILDIVPVVAALGLALFWYRRVRSHRTEMQKKAAATASGICAFVGLALGISLFVSAAVMAAVHGAFWFGLKVGGYIYCFVWVRFTLLQVERERLMRQLWRIVIPVGFVNLITTAMAVVGTQDTGLPMRLTTIAATVATLGAGVWLAKYAGSEAEMQAAEGE